VSDREPPPGTGDRQSALGEVSRAADPALAAHAVADPPPGRWETSFPDDPDRAFVVAAVYEGWLMHYGTPTAFTAMDDDLRLLGGDALYALGLARLASLGDLEGVAELAALISLCARLAAEGRSELTDDLWRASVRALSGERDGGAAAAFARLAPPTSQGAADR
jgi:hypothetical protein